MGKSKIPGEAAECDVLRTTLNTVPGWSGGPVVNMQGEVVGINTKAIALNRDFVEAYRGRAAVREKRNDLEGAIADYVKLIRLLPKAEADALEPKLAEIYKERAKARAAPGTATRRLRTSAR